MHDAQMIALPHIAQRLFNTPLMIHDDKYRAIVAALEPHLLGRKPAALWDEDGPTPAAERRHYAVTRGVAVIDVRGTLVHRGAHLRAYSGLTGYEAIAADFRQALGDVEAEAVLFRIGSPGGEVSGLFDLVDEIAAARGDKPIWAVADDMAMSAAYALASACERILVPRTGYVGSIGVITSYLDISAWLKREGVRFNLIYRGARKADGHPSQPLSDDARADIEHRVDAIYQLFTTTVGGHGRLSAEEAVATEAGIYMGTDAVDAGLADDVASFEAALDMLAAEIGHGPAAGTTGAGTAAGATGEENRTMSTTSPKAPGARKSRRPAKAEAAEQPQDDEEETPAAEDEEEETEGAAAAEDEEEERPEAEEDDEEEEAPSAAAAERRRIAAIVGSSEARGRESLAHHLAFNTAMPAKDAIAALKAAPKGSGKSALQAAMGAVPNPVVGSDAGAPVSGDAAVTERILGNFRRATGRK